MTLEQQRIAIAEACGWKWRTENDRNHYWQRPDDTDTITRFWVNKDHENAIRILPDYLNDLNAMHEAWLTLSKIQQDIFAVQLAKVMGLGNRVHAGKRIDCGTKILGATAVQRAEAFLRTIGKWEDDA